jgi:hypothetical protein
MTGAHKREGGRSSGREASRAALGEGLLDGKLVGGERCQEIGHGSSRVARGSGGAATSGEAVNQSFVPWIDDVPVSNDVFIHFTEREGDPWQSPPSSNGS